MIAMRGYGHVTRSCLWLRGNEEEEKAEGGKDLANIFRRPN